MSVIAPVIGFSVGTRLSAKRIELASQAARSYIDWVKVDSETRGPKATSADKSTDVSAPNTSSALSSPCPASTYCDTTDKTLFCVDGDGNGTCEKSSLKDMIVQGVSKNKTWSTTTNYTQGYALWVRVYRADSFKLSSLAKQAPNTSVNAAGGDPKFPLMTLITEIEPKSSRDAMDNLRNRLCEEVIPRPSTCPSSSP
jgi:type II secretory pathway pseudopilin PulG